MDMMKSVKLLLAAALFLFLGSISAQGVNLRIDSNALAAIDTLRLGQVDSFNITIYNDSNTYFWGQITIDGLINFVPFYGDSAQNPVFYPNSNISDSIPAHGSVSRMLIVTVTNPPFIVGTSGVVIWPKVTAQTYPLVPATISDSISKLVTVFYPLGINEASEKGLKVFMAGEQLLIQAEAGTLLKDVELYDIEGRLLQQQSISGSGIIDMSHYCPGAYLARVFFADNTSVVVKVLNTR
jgi:hypothetical protein